jgi:hypothetical protein
MAEKTLIEDMEEVLGEMANPSKPEPPPDPRPSSRRSVAASGHAVSAVAAPPPNEPDVEERVKFENGFPNPLGIPLTSCHLPKEFVHDPVDPRYAKLRLSNYVKKHKDPSAIARVTPSVNERKLYMEYVRLCRPGRPLTPRWFSVAVRLIVQGKPIEDADEASFDTFAL